MIKDNFITKLSLYLKHWASSERGVSLLEVGLVFAVSSSLIIGVVGGRKVIDNAKTNQIYEDTNKFTRAIEEFEEKYGFIPGDIPNFNQFYPSLPNTVNGNGDGVININTGEELMFWFHLSESKILPMNMPELNGTGVFDDEFMYVPADGNTVGTVPKGPLENSRYRVQYNTERGFFFDLTRYISTAGVVNLTISQTDYAMVSPRRLWTLDTKFDDGSPNSGNIVALERVSVDFPVVNANDCFTSSNDYNLSNDGDVCTLRVFINKFSAKETAVTPLVCTGATIGVKRIRSSTQCPDGTEGKVYDVCQDDGSWKESYESCLPATCSDNVPIGVVRSISCPEGYSGRLSEECSIHGTWVISGVCDLPEIGSPCDEDITLACPRGEAGNVQYTCISGVLSSPINTCSTLSCDGNQIGEVRSVICPTNFTGNVKEACTYDTRSGENWKPISNSCAPMTESCNNTIEDIRQFDCPPGEQGTIRQRCAATGSWVTEIIDCQRIECSRGYYVGDSRVATNFAQCTSEVGEVIEICSIDANNNSEWVLDTSNCVDPLDVPGAGGVTLSCESAYDETDGHSIWPETEAGQTAITECEQGFQSLSGTPSRECSADGIWSNIITNECQSYVFDEPDYYDINLRLWLDASDSSTVDLDGANVLTWNNKAADEIINGLSSRTSSSRPIYSPNGSLHVIEFSGGQFLSDDQPPSYGGAYTLFIVADVGDVGSGRYFADINGHYWLNDGDEYIEIGRDNALPQSFSSYTGTKTGLQIYMLVNDTNNNMVLYMNNTLTSNTGNTAIGLGDFAEKDTKLGISRFDGVDEHMEGGSIAEVILYDRVLTDDERALVFDYLDSKW